MQSSQPESKAFIWEDILSYLEVKACNGLLRKHFVKLQAKSLEQELTLFYPCHKNKNKNKKNKKNKNPSPKGGVHSSRIKCKGVQLTQKNWHKLANFLKNVEEHPPREQKCWMFSYIFQDISVQWWMLPYIFQEMGQLLPVILCYI